jgi:hypothetical protein
MAFFKLILALLTLLASTTWAQSPHCSPNFSGRLPLTLVNNLPVKKNPVVVQWHLDGKNLSVSFDVAQAVLNQKKIFGPTDYPFQFDVVEIFMAVGNPSDKNFHYYELEVTPNEQIFNVHFELLNGKLIREEGVNLAAQTNAKATSSSWSGSFSIPLEQLGWEGNPEFIRANFYAITDKRPNRQFWSAFLPKTNKPNFNKPEYFKSLFQCK